MTLLSHKYLLWLTVAYLCSLTGLANAEHQFSLGAWATYQYFPGDKVNTDGEFTDEALVFYADGKAEAGDTWSYSVEARLGPGGFTDPDNNSTGNEFTFHKAWLGWQLNENHILKLGKSQLPFGWKTTNFWPGDMLLAGYGDQMDVGLKLSGQHKSLQYDLAYYHSDDWSSTSTDTVDDNRHWGSSTTFRKVKTWVGNTVWNINEDNQVGVSVQSGQLEDLTGTPSSPSSGSHRAYVIYYEGNYNDAYYKASYIRGKRQLPDAYFASASLPEEIKNTRLAATIGYNLNDWAFYFDATYADPRTQGSSASSVTAYSPGVRYDYGPGWIYLEYLIQNGYVDRNGQVGEGDFDAIYLSVDVYL
ncbi:hypothetical protein ACFVYJ_08480 [Pontibacter sp. JAM-7]|uniref:hypothetical protein n=1 Tax=Pontibacter sp. JAM-7 TaxID=3366581 RepID=UPI003AF7F887